MDMKKRFKQLYKAVDEENVSFSEIVELEEIAAQLGIEYTDQMILADLVLAIEEKLA